MPKAFWKPCKFNRGGEIPPIITKAMSDIKLFTVQHTDHFELSMLALSLYNKGITLRHYLDDDGETAILHLSHGMYGGPVIVLHRDDLKDWTPEQDRIIRGIFPLDRLELVEIYQTERDDDGRIWRAGIVVRQKR
jgi:hypothetical protein